MWSPFRLALMKLSLVICLGMAGLHFPRNARFEALGVRQGGSVETFGYHALQDQPHSPLRHSINFTERHCWSEVIKLQMWVSCTCFSEI